MVSLQTECLCACDSVCDKNLSYIVRFSRGQVAVDDVLEREGEDLAIGVACNTAGRFGGENDDNGACYVAGCFGAHPRVVILSSFRGRGVGGEGSGRCVVSVVGLGGPFLLLDFLVAFEVEGFGHCGLSRLFPGGELYLGEARSSEAGEGKT